MAITINGKTYRNLQEQVEENVKDIEDLQERVDDGYYTKEESDAKFQTKIGMALYATQQQLNLNIAATEARTDLLLANKQDTLVSGTNIKTINGNSLVGSGNVNIDTNYTAGYGISINNDIIAIDQNIVATTSLLNGYIKDNDTNYASTFRGKGVYVKEEGQHTTTIYGDGTISRSIPRTEGYTYTLPSATGTLALTRDIPTVPTKTSDLQNDSGFITSSAIPTYTAGTGIDITNSVISVDNSVLTTSTAAEVAMTGSYNDLSNTPNLAAVATSGAYNDLSGKPNLATVATTGNYSDLIGKPTEHTYYCTMKIKTTDNKTYVFSKYFTTTENVMPSSGHNWYGANMLKYIRYGGSVWFCSSTGDASNIPVQTLIYADYVTSGSSYIFDAYNINGYMNTFTMNLSNCNVYLNEV